MWAFFFLRYRQKIYHKIFRGQSLPLLLKIHILSKEKNAHVADEANGLYTNVGVMEVFIIISVYQDARNSECMDVFFFFFNFKISKKKLAGRILKLLLLVQFLLDFLVLVV